MLHVYHNATSEFRYRSHTLKLKLELLFSYKGLIANPAPSGRMIQSLWEKRYTVFWNTLLGYLLTAIE